MWPLSCCRTVVMGMSEIWRPMLHKLLPLCSTRLVFRRIGRLVTFSVKYLRCDTTVSQRRQAAAPIVFICSESDHLFNLDEAAIANGAHKNALLSSESLHGAHDVLCKNTVEMQQ